MSIAKGMWQLVRPMNVAITTLSVVVGACAAVLQIDGFILLAAISAALIGAGGNAINDVFDIQIDRVNRPDRPLPKGVVSLREGRYLSYTLFAAGVALSIPIGWHLVIVAALAALLLIWYSALLKQMALVGNLTVAFVAALAFIYGGLAAGELWYSAVPAVLAFLVHLGRELVKDAEDFVGDAAQGARTLAVVAGPGLAVRCGAAALLLVVVALPWPYVWGWFGQTYLCVAGLGVAPVMLWSAWVLVRRPDSSDLALVSSVVKWDMLVGLAAILLDRTF